MLRDFLTCCSLAQSQQAARCPPQSVAACLLRAARRSSRTAMTTYPQKIAFGEMREMAARDVLIYCRDYLCPHHIEINAAGPITSDCWTSSRSSSVRCVASAAARSDRSLARPRWALGLLVRKSFARAEGSQDTHRTPHASKNLATLSPFDLSFLLHRITQ
jgi:hypothetical protein